MINRRQFLKLSAAAGAGLAAPLRLAGSGGLGRIPTAFAAPLGAGLSDPALQPKFFEPAPNALDPGYKYAGYTVGVGYNPNHETGLINPTTNARLKTPIFGYGENGAYLWPGKTFEVQSGTPTTITWNNNLPNFHLLPVDTSLHWAYSLHGYTGNTIESAGVPIIVHLHGGHTNWQFDGNPEFFYSPGNAVVGPQWDNVPGGFTNTFTYLNDQPAGNLWYHDHALGITRLNVYAGMAGFYFVRDANDTGAAGNPLGLPAGPFELAYAIQDRMFDTSGNLFYPAFPGEPFWADFIPPGYAGPEPSALAEFFGDHMVVNGKIWPRADVEPRQYRIHLLNGCDSRFLAIRLRAAKALASIDLKGAGRPIPFWVVGSDQGLSSAATQTDSLIIGPGERYDIVVDFSDPALAGQRIIMENIANDAPFAGNPRGSRASTFTDRQTDRIMAFDVVVPFSGGTAAPFNPANFGAYTPIPGNNDARVRKVALFEGMDEYGRLQPLLGTAEPATDYQGNPINWPNTQPYIDAGLVGQMEGAIAWHSPTTENPALGTTELWEIYNTTPDAHPVHLHLVHFDPVDRQKFKADVLTQPVVQHNGTRGTAFRMANIKLQGKATPAGGVEAAPKDMVTAYPGQVTRIRATFDKPGRYVWHCHILSHEDHEMMRVLHVGPGAG
jgi:FtsP/CotA-like multicopper oxidase with cupredoxin domain